MHLENGIGKRLQRAVSTGWFRRYYLATEAQAFAFLLPAERGNQDYILLLMFL